MFWKILGVIILVWVGFAVLGSVLEGLFGLVVFAAVVFGLYWLYKAITAGNDRDVTKL